MLQNEMHYSEKSLGELLDEGLIYIKPVYVKDIGLVSEIVTEKSKVYFKKKTITIVKNICWNSIVDYRALKYKAASILGQKYALPLCINDNISLLPFKMIKPIGGDSGQGYVNFNYIKSFKEISDKPDNKISIITLKNDEKIEVFTSAKTCSKHYRDCSMLMLLRYEINNEMNSRMNFNKSQKPADYFGFLRFSTIT